jgi:hypothetical protein
MQGSFGGASSLLYSAAVTVRFFDAVALALFAGDLGLVLSKGEIGTQVWRPVWRTGLEACVSSSTASGGGTTGAKHLSLGGDFRLADKTAVQFFVALRRT